MEKILRPERLDVSPTSPTAARDWKHWISTFQTFLTSITGENVNKWGILINFVSPTVYEYIAECATYDTAIALLKELYVKPKNEVFARHSLATRRQQEGEGIDQYLQELVLLSKDCNFKSVSAVQNRDDCIRDAFINGLSSHSIRQRLLENKVLDLSAAIDQARPLDTAQRNSEMYSRSTGLTSAAACGPEPVANTDSLSTSELTDGSSASIGKKMPGKCYFCGGSRHPRYQCPARNSNCHKCSKQGHFAKVCRSAQGTSTSPNQAAALSAISAATPDQLKNATVGILIDGKEATALIDTGSTESFISQDYTVKQRLKVIPVTGFVSMANSSLVSPIKGRYMADINLLGELYTNTCLSVMPDLCSDVILGRDLMSQHSSVTVNFGGPRKNLMVPNSVTCNVPSAMVETPLLFSTLVPPLQADSY